MPQADKRCLIYICSSEKEYKRVLKSHNISKHSKMSYSDLNALDVSSLLFLFLHTIKDSEAGEEYLLATICINDKLNDLDYVLLRSTQSSIYADFSVYSMVITNALVDNGIVEEKDFESTIHAVATSLFEQYAEQYD